MFDVCPGGLMETAEGRQNADACINKLWCNDVCSAGWKDFIVPGVMMWFCWAVFYYIVVLVLLRPWAIANKKRTLYDDCMKKPLIGGFVNMFPHSLKGLAYMFTHFAS